MSGFLVQWNAGRLEMIFPDNAPNIYIKLKKDYAEKYSEATGI